jgi:hypothetical protein
MVPEIKSEQCEMPQKTWNTYESILQNDNKILGVEQIRMYQKLKRKFKTILFNSLISIELWHWTMDHYDYGKITHICDQIWDYSYLLFIWYQTK